MDGQLTDLWRLSRPDLAVGRYEIAQLAGETTVGHSSVQRALGALRGRGLIERSTLSSKAVYALTDPVFELWSSRNGKTLLQSAYVVRPPAHRRAKR